MSFRSAYASSEADDQQPHSLDYNSRPMDQSMNDLYGSQYQFNTSINSSFNHSLYAGTPSRSYSVQDIATLPGLAAGQGYGAHQFAQHPHNYHVNNQMAAMQVHNGSAYPPAPSAGPYMDPAYAQWLVRYKQWYDYVQNLQRERMRQMQPLNERARLTPHRFPHRHTRVSFGGSNQLVTAKGTIVSIQQIDPSLIDLEEEIQVTTWPGPLSKGETKKDEVLEYIRTRESVLKHDQSPESYFKSHERKQIWSLLSMIVRQNGILSGADLSELLLSNNENEFDSPDEADDIGKLRRYLTLGQKKTALEFAQKTGLWGHVTSLVLFSTPVSSPSSGPADPLSAQFSKVVSKFMNSTLSREDPLFILYRSLLTKVQTPVSSATTTGNKQQQQVTTDTLQQFAILLANDCDVNPCVKEYSRASELLKLIVGIKNDATQHIVNLANLDLEHDGSEKSFKDQEQNYSEELVFINEIWEYARPQTQFIERLVPLKTLLASRLFDFGLVNQASRYCYAIRQYFTYYSLYFPGKAIADSTIDWDVVIDFVTDLECRIYGFDVTKGANDQSDITEKKAEAEEDRSIVTDGASQADVDTDDEITESEWDPPLAPKIPLSKQQPQQPQRKQSLLQRRESQMSSASGATSADAGSRAASSQAVVSPGPRMRTRTISKETASPPTTPARNGPSPQSVPVAAAAVPLAAAAKSTFQSSSLSPNEGNASSAQFFVPAAQTASNGASEAIPEFNFVSSYAPSPDSPLSPNFPDDLRDDGDTGRRESLTPFVHNSTAVPGFSSPGQFPSVFSPIAAPDPADQSDRMNGLNQSQNSSHSQSQQNHHQNQSQKQQENGSNVSRDSPIDGQDRSSNKTSGWFNNLIRKVVPPGAKQAVLPDDKNPTIVYDERLKRWVDKSGSSDNQLLDAIQNGPPRIPAGMTSATSMPQLSSMASGPGSQPPLSNGGGNNFAFMTGANRRKPQYVDVWQQQQQNKPQSRN